MVMVSECMYICPQFQPLNQLTISMKLVGTLSSGGIPEACRMRNKNADSL
jgi:hypothetical protein